MRLIKLFISRKKHLPAPTQSSKTAFTLIELLVSILIFAIIGIGAFEWTKSQRQTSTQMLKKAAQLDSAQRILDLFESDIRQIDPNWQKFGVSSIYPHPGYRFGENFYTGGAFPDKGVSDAVTFLKTHPSKKALFNILTSAQHPPPHSSDPTLVSLFEDFIYISTEDTSDSANIEVHDWVIAYKAGSYTLAIVSEVEDISPREKKIRISFPNSGISKRVWQDTSGTDIENQFGYVVQPGATPASFDYTGSVTPSNPADNTIRLTKNESFLQVVQVISYHLDWKKTGMRQGFGAGATNNASMLLDQQGNKIPLVLRTAHDIDTFNIPGGATSTTYSKTELLGQAESLAFTYDIINQEEKLIRDVGRKQNTKIDGFLVKDHTLEGVDENHVLASSNIVGVRMVIESRNQSHTSRSSQFLNQKTALNSHHNDKNYQNESIYRPEHSGNFHQRIGLTETEQMGKPFFHEHPDGKKYIVIPVFNLDPTAGNMRGKLIFLKPNGCAATEVCDTQNPAPDVMATDTPDFIVEFGSDTTQFFPTHVQEIVGADLKAHLFIGGLGTDENGEIKPMFASIGVGSGSIDTLLTPALTQDSSGCSIENCHLHMLSDDQGIKDTGSGFVSHNGDIYTVPTTKSDPLDSDIALYKTSIDANGVAQPFQKIVVDSSGIGQGRVVTAIGNEVMYYSGHPYIPACLTRKLPCITTPVEESEVSLLNIYHYLNPIQTCQAEDPLPASTPCETDPTDYGKIVLLSLNGTSPTVELAQHNYKCSSIQPFQDDYLITGKLTPQVMKSEDIRAIVNGSKDPLFLFTDEKIDPTQNYYADEFKVNTNTLEGNPPSGSPSDFGFNLSGSAGTHVRTFSDGSVGITHGNRLVMALDEDITDQNVLSLDVTLGGMRERLHASIDTNIQNLNQSFVHTAFQADTHTLPNSTFLPGMMFSTTPRTVHRTLPHMNQIMTPHQWRDFFIHLNNPHI